MINGVCVRQLLARKQCVVVCDHDRCSRLCAATMMIPPISSLVEMETTHAHGLCIVCVCVSVHYELCYMEFYNLLFILAVTLNTQFICTFVHRVTLITGIYCGLVCTVSLNTSRDALIVRVQFMFSNLFIYDHD